MAQRESSTLGTLPGSFIRYNNEEILTIRKEGFGPFLSEDAPVKQGKIRLSSFRSGRELFNGILGELRPNALNINISKEISVDSQAVPAVMRETENSSPYNILSLDNKVASKGVLYKNSKKLNILLSLDSIFYISCILVPRIANSQGYMVQNRGGFNISSHMTSSIRTFRVQSS